MEGGLLGFSFSLGSGYEIFLFIHKTDCVTCLLHCVLVYSLVFFITNAFRLLLAPFFFGFLLWALLPRYILEQRQG